MVEHFLLQDYLRSMEEPCANHQRKQKVWKKQKVEEVGEVKESWEEAGGVRTKKKKVRKFVSKGE